MTIRVDEAVFLQNTVVGTAQRTVHNDTGGAIVKGEVFKYTNADNMVIGMVGAGDIAVQGRGEAYIHGEFSFIKMAGIAFEALDDIYWRIGHNDATDRAHVKAGDFWIAKCTKHAASTDGFVHGELGLPDMQHISLSVSTSLSSTSSSSDSDSSASSSSDSSDSSRSNSSESTSSSLSVSSNSTSSDSSESVSSNSDSSSSKSV